LSDNGRPPWRYFDDQAERYHASSTRPPWSWLRRREARAVLELIGGAGHGAALDLASGAGYYARLLRDRGVGRVVAVDRSFAMISQVPREGILRVVAEASSMSLRRPVDVVVCAGLLEFVADPSAVLANIRRLAARAVVLVPRRGAWGRGYGFYHRRHGLRIRLYSTAEVAALAGRTGWRVEEARSVWPGTIVFRLAAEA
jgi:SAM-dependent methyltransferase